MNLLSASFGQVTVVRGDGRAPLKHVFIRLKRAKLTFRDENLILAHQLTVRQGRVRVLADLRPFCRVRLQHV